VSDAPGLRERKKRQTRRLIADVATDLFVRRGFDKVTVAEVAEAADVSTKTIFNYFPRKEDMFFDREQEAAELLTRAIRDRPAGETPMRALRRLFVEAAEEGRPLGGFRPGFRYFLQTVVNSAALRARARELVQAAERLIGDLFAEAAGAGPQDIWPRLQGVAAVSAYRVVYLESVRRLLDGEPVDAIVRDHVALLHRAFDALERGFGPS
jgi:AcrR family transcriptional regulator